MRRYLTALVWFVFANYADPTKGQDLRANGITYANLRAFEVMGIQIRTTNAKEATAEGVIPKQWQKFFREGVLQKIPHRTSPDICTLFTSYDSDRSGEYSYVIGAMVEKGTAPTDGMLVKRVPSARYAILNSDEGPLSEVVPRMWQRVWKLEDEGTLRRSYKTDFEVYAHGRSDTQYGRVRVYVGVK